MNLATLVLVVVSLCNLRPISAQGQGQVPTPTPTSVFTPTPLAGTSHAPTPTPTHTAVTSSTPIPASNTSTVPLGWTCDASFYNTTDGCDCGCGVRDPDCNTSKVFYDNCGSGKVCVLDQTTCVTAPQCQLPSVVGISFSGECSGARAKDSCAARCESGYSSRSVFTIDCELVSPNSTSAAQFQGVPTSVCVAAGCPIPPAIDHVVYNSTCNNLITGTSCETWCEAGYRSNVSRLHCIPIQNSAAPILSALPDCIAATCQLPHAPGVIFENCDDLRTGQSCFAFCADLFIGNATNPTCTADGDMLTTATLMDIPTCDPIGFFTTNLTISVATSLSVNEWQASVAEFIGAIVDLLINAGFPVQPNFVDATPPEDKGSDGRYFFTIIIISVTRATADDIAGFLWSNLVDTTLWSSLEQVLPANSTLHNTIFALGADAAPSIRTHGTPISPSPSISPSVGGAGRTSLFWAAIVLGFSLLISMTQ